ncbi:MAG TPA: hypothetical protein VH084_14660 [Mycobacterium sp.]|jgi:hypothetical protein|nr:hypothetical protein [Mycobacterium sp.]
MPLSPPAIFTIHAAFTEQVSAVDGHAALTCAETFDLKQIDEDAFEG